MIAENVRANTTNTSANTYYTVLSFLEAQPEEWTPFQLAKELRMPRGTVGWVLKQLKEDGKVFFIPRGKIHCYAATRRFTDDFNRMFKAYPTDRRYEIHGLSLKLQGFTNTIPLGGGGVVRDGFDCYGGHVSFQLSRETFMVWGRFTDAPLDWDRFVLFLSAVDGFCLARNWERIEGNIQKWKVVQYGFNRDWKRFRNDSPTKCLSLQGFKHWFARCYQKEGLGVLREEIHSREEKSLEDFIHLVDGSMTSVQVMNYLEILARSVNESHAIQSDMVKKIGILADAVDKVTVRLSKLQGSVV